MSQESHLSDNDFITLHCFIGTVFDVFNLLEHTVATKANSNNGKLVVDENRLSNIADFFCDWLIRKIFRDI